MSAGSDVRVNLEEAKSLLRAIQRNANAHTQKLFRGLYQESYQQMSFLSCLHQDLNEIQHHGSLCIKSKPNFKYCKFGATECHQGQAYLCSEPPSHAFDENKAGTATIIMELENVFNQRKTLHQSTSSNTLALIINANN